MRHAGYEVLEAGTGLEGLALAMEERPDLVLLDVVLPDLSGEEVCRRIRQCAEISGVFVVLISSSQTTPGHHVAGLEAGADAYIVRPIEGRELVARVQALLRFQQTQTLLRQACEDLEGRVALRTTELTAARERLMAEASERRELESRLLRTQKLDVAGRLAAGLAHDFNNLLTVISCNVSLLLEDPRLGQELRPRLADISRAAERGADLTRRLLTFTRQQEYQPRPFDLNGCVADLAGMLRSTLGEKIEVSVELDPALPRISADPGMIEQSIVNLAVNARDAMPQGGKLRMKTGVRSVDSPEAVRRGLSAIGPYVHLTMADDGCGMDAVTRERIFEAFFTTKEPGKGTGLGLSTVHGIVAQHGGWIEVESEPGAGATFRVHFPALSVRETSARAGDTLQSAFDALSSLPPPPARSLVPSSNSGDSISAWHGTETILVVEDQVAVRAVAKTILQYLGYRVVTAESGAAALELWPSHRAKVDLLLTDVVMPQGVDGRELAARLRSEKPDLRVVLMSGFGAEAEGPEIKLPSDFMYVSKPFDPAALGKAVRESLDRGRVRTRDRHAGEASGMEAGNPGAEV